MIKPRVLRLSFNLDKGFYPQQITEWGEAGVSVTAVSRVVRHKWGVMGTASAEFSYNGDNRVNNTHYR